MSATGAQQRRHRSEQSVGTPRAFLNAVDERFGELTWDLAATTTNAVVGHGCFLGPGSEHGEDSLAVDWAMLPGAVNGRLWLNPPFGKIAPFAKKCAEQATSIAGQILLLVPASVSTEWFATYVHRRALILAIRPRLKFVGHEDPYPKDLALCVFGRWVVPAFETWRWDGKDEAF